MCCVTAKRPFIYRCIILQTSWDLFLILPSRILLKPRKQSEKISHSSLKSFNGYFYVRLGKQDVFFSSFTDYNSHPQTGVVAAVVAAAAWFAQAWLGTTQGIVYKNDPVYDFIVVGAGTAGSVVAARLSETPHHRVLLLEAGGEEPWLSSIPLAAPLLQGSRYDWKYMTTPQKKSSEALVGKRSAWPRGRVLGGSGSINYNIHMHGSPQDFQAWEQQYGATGWGFAEMKKYANKAECLRLRPKLFKEECTMEAVPLQQKGCSGGSNGTSKEGQGHVRQPQDAVQCYDPPIRTQTASSILTSTFLAAGKELGLPVGNLNDEIDYGVMAARTTVFKGHRWSSFTGYLKPSLGRPNLHVMLHTQVTKVVWDGKRAVGVEFVQWDNARLNGTVYARGEVILSGGAINTPLLLTHSGVGPKHVLKKLQIPEVSPLSGVGSNLQDHLNLPLYVSLEKPVSLNLAKLRTVSNLWNYFFNSGKGDLGQPAIEGVGVMPGEGKQQEVAAILFNMGAVDKHLYSEVANMKLEYFEKMFPGMDNQSQEGFIFLVTCLHPQSTGHLQVVSSDPRQPPVIDPGYLSHPADLPCMRHAFKFGMRLLRTKAFQSLGAAAHLPRYKECVEAVGGAAGPGPGEDARARYKEYVNCIVRIGAITGYHPLGTARLGQPDDPKAVVDLELRVIGTERLRVVDASVMPTQISGTPNSAIIVIAEKASDLIKASWSNSTHLASQRLCSSSPDCEQKLLAKLDSSSGCVHPSLLLLVFFLVLHSINICV
ncbi:neither inactivation nor afterpotential protein G-like isoform X2 [Scylla paramamosain]|uniref:neither inactivation nor afterpotential protein G-like isoform X2 n=1 Tax=Scylla paramamosain TaxID=85552 RepID=UPI003082B3B1